MIARTCAACGSPLSASARYCTSCGAPAPEPALAPEPATAGAPPPAGGGPVVGMAQPLTTAVPPGWVMVRAQQTSGAAITSFVMGMLTWTLPFLGIGLFSWVVTAPFAVAAGASARRQIAASPDTLKGEGFVTAGLVLGLSALVLITLIVSLLVLARLS